jgi:TRAP-type C4-dicarboxylate transport system substrate-binding protein
MKKFIIVMLIVFSGTCLLCQNSFAKEKEEITIKIATLSPRGSNVSIIFEELKQEIKTQTNNEVGFKIYYGGIQGDAKDVLRKIRFKQLHGATLASYGLGQIAKECRVTGLPYVFKNYEEVDYVRSNLEEYMDNAFEKNGFIVLGWYDVGFVYSFSKVPITSLEVARQQKFWAPEGDVMAMTVYKDVLGITPVSLSITDVLTSLSTRLIDAASAPPLAAVAFRWYTRFKYMSEYPSTNVLCAFVVTKDIWEKITPESRKIIKELSRNHFLRIQNEMRETNKKSIDVLKKSGITIVRLQDAKGHKKYIEDTAQKTKEALVGKLFSRELLERTMSLLEEYREKHPDSTVLKIPE